MAVADPPTGYVIGEDDVLEVSVANHEDLNRTLTVLQDGKITFPEVGEVDAAGKTPKQVAAIIKAGLDKTRNKVEVLVSVKEAHSLRVRVLGGVKSSGAFDLKRDWRLMDLIAAAGGLNQKPSHITGRVIRHGTESIPLDVEQAVSHPETAANLLLERDDLVLLDEQEATHFQVYVMGQVGKPGSYELSSSTTALSLLSEAGNPTERAALSGTYVLRAGAQLPLNLRPTFRGKADPAVSNFKFQPGDVIFIPEVETKFAVMGQVGRSGYFPFPESGNITVIDALNLAGGATNGNTAQAGILRKVNGKPTVIPVNIDQMLRKGDLSKNITLQPDDVLFIPAKSERKFNWTDILAPITALGYLGFHL
jgi:polysaccharide export outer membrane protein